MKPLTKVLTFAVLLIGLVLAGIYGLVPTNALKVMSPIYSLIMTGALICLIISLGNLFNFRKLDGEVEFSDLSWFFMIFSCGMGIGILNYSFQEVAMLSEYHDNGNPIGQMINHWTLIPWGIYTAYCIFHIYDNKYDLSPKWFKNIRDILYSISMMLGIGISFALGVTAISGSLAHIYNIHIPPYVLVILLGLLVAISVFRGMHKGLKVFSNVTMIIFIIYSIALLFQPREELSSILTEGLSGFFGDFFYNNIFHGSALQINWTVYYVVWFWSWVPFVTPFVLRISKGRSISSLVVALLLLPSIVTTVFMCIGTSVGLHQLSLGVDPRMIQFASIQGTWYLPILFILLMCAFYVTSSDSQSLTIDHLLCKDSKIKLVYRKLIWIAVEVGFVSLLLIKGSNTIDLFVGMSLLVTPLLILIGVYYIIKILICKYNNYYD